MARRNNEPGLGSRGNGAHCWLNDEAKRASTMAYLDHRVDYLGRRTGWAISELGALATNMAPSSLGREALEAIINKPVTEELPAEQY